MKKTTKKKTTKTAPKKTRTSARRAKQVAPVPAGCHTVTPHLILRDTARALEFYKQAFGAKELSRMTGPDGSVAHAEMRIGDSIVMLGDEMPSMGATAPQTVGGSPVHISLMVPNVDALFDRAVKAGATVQMPLQDMFWGDRYGKLLDPFGHKWGLGMHIEDVSPKEMARRAEKEFSRKD